MNDIPVDFSVVNSLEETPVISEAELVFAVQTDSCFKTEIDVEAIIIIEGIIRAEKTDGESGTGGGEKVEAVAESHASTDMERKTQIRDVISIFESHVKQ